MIVDILVQIGERKNKEVQLCNSFNPKDTGGGDFLPQATIRLIAPYLGIEPGPLISLDSSMSIPVILDAPLRSRWTAKC